MSKTLCSFGCIGSFAMLLELLSLADGVEVFFHATGEDELYIGLRLVIDQEVQLAAVDPCCGELVFYGDAVYREATSVGEDGFYTVGIEIKAVLVKGHHLLPSL